MCSLSHTITVGDLELFRCFPYNCFCVWFMEELREEEADVEVVAAGSFSPELMHGDDRSAFKVHT